jgi:hypothetical protein
MNVITSQLSPHKKINKVIIKLFPENRKSTIVIGSLELLTPILLGEKN